MNTRPNLYIVGHSKIGKSPLAAHLARELGFTAISGSEWVKARHKPSGATGPDYVREITDFSCAALAIDPDACVNFIRGKYDVAAGGLVIEGLRNPRDFTMLFRPDVDLVVFLEHAESEFQPTSFEERGVAAIHGYVMWLALSIYGGKRVNAYRLDALRGTRGRSRADIAGNVYSEPCWNLDECMNFATEWARPLVAPVPANVLVHANIAPFDALVEDRVLYNEEPREGVTKCSVFGVSSYPGHAPTFNVLLANGSVFSYVPVHRLRTRDVTEPLEHEDLVYHDCPSERIVVTAYEALQRPLRAYFVKRDRWLGARYFCTVDWFEGNNLLHILALDNGQFAMLPSHKVLFASGGELPRYKKLRAEWKVGKSADAGNVD